MDIAARKMELVEWLLQINDETLLEKIMNLKSDLDQEVVAHTKSGYSGDKKEYINQVREADERISSGKFTTIEDLEIENYTEQELEVIAISIDHKYELEKRLESYRENPQDLLDWDAVKDEW